MPGPPENPVLGGVEYKHPLLPPTSGGAVVQTEVDPPFIASVTVVYAPSVPEVNAPFIASVTAVYAPGVGLSTTTFTTPGTYTWVCPSGITEVDVKCYGGGGGGGTGQHLGLPFTDAAGGGGGGAYAERIAVPVTPGTTYTVVVGAGGTSNGQGNTAGSGTDSTFTGDSGVQVIAKGGGGASGPTHGTGGAAGSSTGDSGLVHSGGNGGDGANSSPNTGGAGGGASGNVVAAGANGTSSIPGTGAGQAGGAGANGGGSGCNGNSSGNRGFSGSAPGGGGGGGAWGTGFFGDSGPGAAGQVSITVRLPVGFITSTTTVYTPTVQAAPNTIDPPFIASNTAVYTPSLLSYLTGVPFIPSITVVYTPELPEVHVPFIASNTHVWNVFSLFDPNKRYGIGPGNGGETFGVRLAANGSSTSAVLARNISASGGLLYVGDDTGWPTSNKFVVTINTEILGIQRNNSTVPNVYRVWARGLGNTAAASHTAGNSATWGDSYDMAITATGSIAASFTADINSSGSTVYPGWLVAFDSSQAYVASGDRYPFHVTEVVGVFDPATGSSGTSRTDGPQPNAIATTTGTSDDCPAALSVPARIDTDINVGDVAVVRYTNPESFVLDLGPRAVTLQSWFGLKRVNLSDVDVTFTNPNGIVVDTTGGFGTYTGSVNGEWADPVPLVVGIAPDASDLAGYAIPTPNPVAWTTVTLDHTDRHFTRTSVGEKAWPMCCLSVRQGNRRVPRWQSWDWHNYSYVYTGFGVDALYAQMLINRNGVVFGSIPVVNFPNDDDLDGPDVVWDDGTYYFGASWYVVLFNTPYLVAGPIIGGYGTTGGGGDITPIVDFGGGPVGSPPGPPVISPPPPIEGGGGGDISPTPTAVHIWQRL